MKATLAVKSLGGDKIAGYGVIFGGPLQKDLTGDYFSAESDLGLDWYDNRPVLYHHGLNKDVGKSVIGRVTSMEARDAGVWVEGELNARSNWYGAVKQLIAKEALSWSSGSIQHLVERNDDGHLKAWPIVEMTVTPAPAEPRMTDVVAMKAAYKAIGIDFELPEGYRDKASTGSGSATEDGQDRSKSLGGNMSKFDKEQLKAIGAVVGATLDARDEATKDAEASEKAFEDKVAAAVKAALAPDEDGEKNKGEKKPAAKALPGDKNEAEKDGVITDVKNRRYDHLTAADLSTLAIVVNTAAHSGVPGAKPLSETGMKALVDRTQRAADGKVDALPYENREVYQGAAIKALAELAGEGIPIKGDMHYSTLSNYGSEWVATAYGSNLWEAIRIGTFLVQRMPLIEVPAGHSSIVIPLEGSDPTWYVVSETTATAASGWPDATITSTRIGTDNVTLTLGKLGARALWTGEMNEDSIIPFVSQLRGQFEVSGQEVMEALILNGDTESGGTGNINDVLSAPSGSEYFMLFNGLRKSCLVTTTANSRDGGVLSVEDYLATVKLMGEAGKNALDRSKVELIVDPLTHYKSLELPEVKTRDVASSPTVEGGNLTSVYGYKVNISGQIAYRGGNLLSNSAGKVDLDDTTQNVYGQILAVRYDQWQMAFRRRMTMETTRIARADTTEIVALVRLGLIQRDTEASAITYNLTV